MKYQGESDSSYLYRYRMNRLCCKQKMKRICFFEWKNPRKCETCPKKPEKKPGSIQLENYRVIKMVILTLSLYDNPL